MFEVKENKEMKSQCWASAYIIFGIFILMAILMLWASFGFSLQDSNEKILILIFLVCSIIFVIIGFIIFKTYRKRFFNRYIFEEDGLTLIHGKNKEKIFIDDIVECEENTQYIARFFSSPAIVITIKNKKHPIIIYRRLNTNYKDVKKWILEHDIKKTNICEYEEKEYLKRPKNHNIIIKNKNAWLYKNYFWPFIGVYGCLIIPRVMNFEDSFIDRIIVLLIILFASIIALLVLSYLLKRKFEIQGDTLIVRKLFVKRKYNISDIDEMQYILNSIYGEQLIFYIHNKRFELRSCDFTQLEEFASGLSRNKKIDIY